MTIRHNPSVATQTSMRAVVLGPQGVAFEATHPVPQPVDGEVAVRVLQAGVCDTDLQLIRGYMNFRGVLGHEFVGIAESGELAGQRVVGEINCSCRTCPICRSGQPGHCPHRSVLGILDHDGAFADVATVPAVNLHRVPQEVSTEQAVFVEPLAAAFQIPDQLPLSGGQRVIVLGDGRLGNLCAQVLRLVGCRVTVVGKHDEKLTLLHELGLEAIHLNEVAPRRVADVVVDCTGSSDGLPTALRFVRPRGTIVLKTTIAEKQTLGLAPLVIDEITLVGSRCGPFPVALAALAARLVDVEPLISTTVPLEEAITAFAVASQPEVVKVLLKVG